MARTRGAVAGTDSKVTDRRVNAYWKDKKYTGDRAPEFKTALAWIPDGSKVLDIGCGNGGLGEKLIKDKNCRVAGIEIDEKRAANAKKKGIRMVEGDADKALPFKDDYFDYTIATDVLEHIFHPDVLVEEMARTSRRAIIATPNSAYFVARFQLFFGGRTPTSLLFGYNWYDTEHIHLCSLTDFRKLIEEKGLRIHKESFWTDAVPLVLARAFPNMFSKLMVIEFSK